MNLIAKLTLIKFRRKRNRQEIEQVNRKKPHHFSHRKMTQIIRCRFALEEFNLFFASELFFALLFGEVKSGNNQV